MKRGILIALCLLCASSWAQLPTATLTGVVTDPQGAVLAGADVKLTNEDTGVTRHVPTGTDGRYIFPNLPPGNYDVLVTASGFGTREFKAIHLEVGRSVTLDAPMQVAKGNEVVVVTGGATGVELDQSEVQGQITERTVQTIPLNGRNFLELAYLLPGNRPATNYDPTKTNTLEVSSAGQFGRGGNITVDGGDNNDEVVGGTLMNFPQDAVHEFQIATNRYTAEVGRSASSIINVVTSSGTNDLHGSLFAFLRNRDLQARSATLAITQPKPPFDRQQFGGSLGGPLVKDKAWFFVSGEDRNQHASVQTGFRDFGTQQVVSASSPSPLDDALLLLRQDIKLNDRDTIFVRYAWNRSLETSNGSLHGGVSLGSAANRQSSLNRFNSILGNWTRVISTDKVNTLIFHVNTFINEIPTFAPTNHPTLITSGAYGAGQLNLGLTNEIVFPDLQDGANFRIAQRTRLQRYQGNDSFAITKGAHNLRFGGEVQRQYSDAIFDLFGSGSIFLAQDFATQDLDHDGVINDNDIPVATAIRSTGPVHPPFVPNINNTYLGFYAQDDWHVLSNLTLNLGLRYELDTEIFGTSSAHDPCPTLTQPSPVPCVWAANVLGLHRSKDPHDFSPRLGFAWDPFKTGRTVIRGGYGIYYDRVVLEVDLLELLLDGRQLSLTATGGSTVVGGSFVPDPVTGQTVTLANPFVGAPSTLAIGINVLDNHIRHPMVQQFTFGVQQQLGQSWVLSADGIHNFGTRFLIGRTIVDADNKPISITDPLTHITNNVVDIGSFAKNWYDGLLVSLRKQPTKIYGRWYSGFSVNYTLSKSLNFANDDQIPFNVSQQIDEKFGINNLRLEKGYSPTDERHRLVVFGTVQAPYDITIAPIVTISSSIPIDSFVSGINSRLPLIARNGLARGVDTGAELNNVIAQWNALAPCPPGGGVFPCHIGPLLSPVNPNLTFGDPFISADMRVTKLFKITERHRIEAVAEVFNLANNANIRGFNNSNYSGRANAIDSKNFYQALSTAGGFFGSGGPRAFQFALRWIF